MKRLLLLSLALPPLLAMEVSNNIVRKSIALSEAKIIYDKEHFIVDNGEYRVIQRYNMNRELRALSDPQIKSMLNKKEVLLYLRKLSDNNYALELQGKIKGGTGPITAWCAGTVTKVLCWTGVMLGSSLIYKGSEKAARGDRTIAAGTSAIAVGGGITAAGGFPAIAASIETAGNAVTAAVLALPIPLP
jgi:hypothetical protein